MSTRKSHLRDEVRLGSVSARPAQAQLALATRRPSIPRQGHQREVQSIHVILEIENLRKTGTGELVFVPVTIELLRRQQVLDAGLHFAARGLAGGDQAEEGPRGLRGGRRSDPRQRRVVVTAARLAPAAARLLRLLEPGDRPPHQRPAHVVVSRLQSAQHLPGAVEVVYAPAADPAAARILRALDERQRPVYLSMADANPELPQRLQGAGSDIRTTRIEHGVMIGEGYAGDDFAVD